MSTRMRGQDFSFGMKELSRKGSKSVDLLEEFLFTRIPETPDPIANPGDQGAVRYKGCELST